MKKVRNKIKIKGVNQINHEQKKDKKEIKKISEK